MANHANRYFPRALVSLSGSGVEFSSISRTTTSVCFSKDSLKLSADTSEIAARVPHGGLNLTVT